jgi:hypothetical protein
MRNIALALAAIAIGVSASAGEIVPDEAVEVEFPAHWVGMMSFAYADFQKTRSDVSCFNAHMKKEGGGYVVSFMPPYELSDGDKITIPVVPGSSRCGRGMYYRFDAKGAFTGKLGVR